MVSKIRRKHIFGDMTCTPTTITNTPKVITPVTTFKLGKFLQQQTGTATFRRRTMSLILSHMFFGFGSGCFTSYQRFSFLCQLFQSKQMSADGLSHAQFLFKSYLSQNASVYFVRFRFLTQTLTIFFCLIGQNYVKTISFRRR